MPPFKPWAVCEAFVPDGSWLSDVRRHVAEDGVKYFLRNLERGGSILWRSLLRVAWVTKLPGIFGQRARLPQERLEIWVDPAARLPQFDKIVRFSERSPVP